MWNDDLCRLIMRFQQEICSEIFLSYQIPAVLGSLFLELGQFTTPKMSVSLGFTYVFGMIVAGVVGYFMIRNLLRILQHAKLRYFAFYCFVAGAIALISNFA